MPQISVHGLNAYYRDEGAGVPVVLGHGSASSSGQWRSLIKRMSGRYRLIAPDHIGYGRTEQYSGDIPLMEHEIAIVVALVRWLAQPVHMVGHSFGGSVLARAAVRMPEQVRSLTLFEPALFYLLAPLGRLSEYAEIQSVAEGVIRYIGVSNVEEAARRFTDYWVGPNAYDAMDTRSREAVRTSIAKLTVEWPTGFDPYGASIEALSKFKMPIQLIGGSRTTSAARAVTDVLRGLWPGAAYAEIEGAGHMAPLTHADLVNEIIDTFIGRSI